MSARSLATQKASTPVSCHNNRLCTRAPALCPKSCGGDPMLVANNATIGKTGSRPWSIMPPTSSRHYQKRAKDDFDMPRLTSSVSSLLLLVESRRASAKNNKNATALHREELLDNPTKSTRSSSANSSSIDSSSSTKDGVTSSTTSDNDSTTSASTTTTITPPAPRCPFNILATRARVSHASPSSDAEGTEKNAVGDFVPLVMHPGGKGHNGMGCNDQTRNLLMSIGGLPAVTAMTRCFYKKFWADAFLQQFLGELHTPLETHSKRLGMYICEMMGGCEETCGQPLWSQDMVTRSVELAPIANGEPVLIDTRQKAHFVALNSVTRKPEDVGLKFQLVDARVWQRLMFWACREVGIAQASPFFFEYFAKWIAHFMPVYEKTSAKFTRADARWSASTKNIQAYLEAGNVMTDIVGVSVEDQLATLPTNEEADGSDWAYDQCITI